MAAAMDEFSTHHYESASLNNILLKADVSKGVFYHHFESKEDLYLHLIGQLFKEKKQFLVQNLTSDDLAGDLFHILRKSMHLSMAFAKSHPYVVPFTDMLLKERGNAIYETVMARYNVDNDAYVSGLIQTATQSGNLRDDLSPDFISRFISHILSHINDILGTHSLEDYGRKVDELLIVLEYGLKRPPR